MRFPSAPVVFAALALPAAALEPLGAPVPLSSPPPANSPGELALARASADAAQALGFPATAATLYRALLNTEPAESGPLTLALAAALLDDGDVHGAGRVLESYGGARGAAWHLRMGLVDAYLGRFDQARAELASAHLEELTLAERGWQFFLQGLLADAANEPARATGFYSQAASSAVSDLQRARFLLAAEQTRLRGGPVTDEQLENDRKNAEKFQNQKIGYGFVREYAIALNALNRKPQAIEVLENALRTLPPQEQAEGDHFRLLLGLIGGPASGVGRQELFALLAAGSEPDQQRIALRLLIRGSPAGAARSELGQRLDRLIAAPTPHPILESLLLARAQLSLEEARGGVAEPATLYARAEDDANELLQRFPGSPLKAQAYAVLAGSAWEQRRYRTAADYGFKAAGELPAGRTRAEFGVLVAEAWFRAGDFQNAADAYAAARRTPPDGIRPGVLMFQQVEAEILAGALASAAAATDELSKDPAFDAQDRWEAEWNLARALEIHGETATAYGRVNRLLVDSPPGNLSPYLQARMAWLQARLSYDAQNYAETLRLVDGLARMTEGLPPAVANDIASTGDLLRAQADFALGRDAAAADTLAKLRAAFPRSDAAVYSYIVEADRAARQDKVVDAERLLTKLADDFPASPYAPYALYQAALQAERLGTEANLKEAYKFLEALVTNPAYARSELIFPARLREGDLLRELNQFPQAQQVYELLVNNPAAAGNRDTILAQLALAECHNAQSSNSPAHADSAERIFQDLVERVDAPADVRVEAGYNLGVILSRTDREKAQAVWWNDVVDAFLVRPGGPKDLGPKGRWWLARTLIDVGDAYEKAGRLDEAKRAWTLVLDAGLPGESLARQRLARFHLPGAKA